MTVSKNNQFYWPVVGHQPQIGYLQKCLSAGHLSHAYLFHGPAAVGKRLIAKLMAMSLYCQSAGAKPCQKCAACHQIKEGSHPDVAFVNRADDKKNITIEQIRDIRFKLKLTALTNGVKIVIINEAETMSDNAANALLKTLEEPAGRTLIILIAERADLLPLTVRSRAQSLRFYLLSARQMATCLTGLIQVNNQLAPNANHQAGALALAFGRPGLALQLAADPTLLADYQQQREELANVLFLPVYQKMQFAQALIKKSSSTNANRDQCLTIINQLEQLWRDLYLIKLDQEPLARHQFLLTKLRDYCIKLTWPRIIYALNGLKEGRAALARNAQPVLVLENCLL